MADERLTLALLLDPDNITYAWDCGLRGDWFEDPMCRTVAEFVLDYWRDSRAVPNARVLTEQFPGWTLPPPDDASVRWEIERLRERRSFNAMQSILLQAAGDARAGDSAAALRSLYTRAYAAAESVEPRRTRLNTAQTITERRERYVHRGEAPGILGVTHGLPELDAVTDGILPGELAVVGGSAKCGKTFWLVNAAVAALRAGHRPLLITLEMGLGEIEDRADAVFCGVGYAELLSGVLSPQQRERLYAGQDEMAALGGLAIERPGEGDRTVVSLCGRARDLDADYLLIDQLSFMEAGRKVDSLKDHHSTIMRDLKNEIGRSGRELPCLMAVQLNRESTGEQGMALTSFANATEVEQTADIALGLQRNAELRRNNAMEVKILGSRRSDIMGWLLRWRLSGATEIAVVEERDGR